MRRLIPVVLAVVVAAVLLGGGIGIGFALGRVGRHGAPPKAARPAYVASGLAVAWTPRPEEHVLHVAPVLDDNLELQPLGITCHLVAVFGTHTEGTPAGRYCRLALAVGNNDGDFHMWRANGQTLVDSTGHQYRPDPFAMQVKRMPQTIEVGGHLRQWEDLWYDVPTKAVITGVRLRGDRDPSGYYALKPGPYAPFGALVRLPEN